MSSYITLNSPVSIRALLDCAHFLVTVIVFGEPESTEEYYSPLLEVCWCFRHSQTSAIGVGHRVLGRKTTVSLSLCHIKGTCYQHDITAGVIFDHLVEGVLVSFSNCKVILCLSFLYWTIWKEVTMWSSPGISESFSWSSIFFPLTFSSVT